MNDLVGNQVFRGEWLEEIPLDWEQRKIRHLFSIKKEIAGELGHEVISITQRGAKLKDTESGEGQLSMDYSKYQLVKRGDFLMNHMDLLTGYVDVSEFDGVTSPDYRVFVPSSVDVHSTYFLYVFQHCYKSKIFYGYGRGSSHLGRWRFPTVEFEDFYLPVPTTHEQKLIARYLNKKTDQIDRLVEKIQRKIDLLKEQRTSLINHYVTKGLDPNVEMKDSGIEWIGKIPKHWEVRPIGSLLKDRNEKNDPIKMSNILSLTAEKGVIPYSEKGNAGNKSKNDLSQYKIARVGDIVVNSMNIISGSVGLSKYEGLVSPVYYMLRPTHSSDLVRFFFYIFKDQQFQRSLFGLGNGILVKQSEKSGKFNTVRLRIPLSKLKSVKIPYVDPIEQSLIVDLIDKSIGEFDTKISLNLKKIRLLQEYRQSLISSAVTGKIRITEDMI